MGARTHCPACNAAVDARDNVCAACGASHNATIDRSELREPDSASSPQPFSPLRTRRTEERRAAPLEADDDWVLAELNDVLSPRIQVLSRLAIGGMGVVYLGRDPLLKRSVAVKVLATERAGDTQSRARFLREAEAAAAVAHPNVVNVFQVGELPRSGVPFLVMQFIAGTTLTDLKSPGNAAPEAQAKRIVGETAAALAAAHARGLVHRDIKPSNIIIDEETGRAIVVDFGISAAMDPAKFEGYETLTQQGVYVGTPTYTSPEQAASEPVNDKSDVYSLGVVAFELVTGKLPFQESTPLGMLAAHMKDAPPKVRRLRPDLDPHFAELIDRCLTKDPKQRPAAADIARQLLPSTQAIIEWPPPGLDMLRGRGARLLFTVGVAVSWVLFFFVTLAAQPKAASARWYEPESSSFWFPLIAAGIQLLEGETGLADLVTGRSEQNAAPLWTFVLGLSAIAAMAAFLIATMLAVHLASRLLEARRSGYPWQVMLDAAWDYWPDTSSVLNGTGSYALLSRRQRARFIKLRRAFGAATVATLVLASILPFIWMSGWLGGWNVSRKLFPNGEVMLFFAPVLVGIAAMIASRLPEARWRHRVRARSLFATAPAISAQREVVAAWLETAGWSLRERPRFFPRTALALVPFVVGLFAVAPMAMVLLVNVQLAHEVHEARHTGFAWADAFHGDSLWWRAIDSSIARTARVAPPSSRVRLEDGLRLMRSTRVEDYERGRKFVREGAELLTRQAQTSRDSGATHRAEDLTHLLRHLAENHPAGRTERALMADPANPIGLRFVADTALPPALRAHLAAVGLPFGFCLDARELLFGVDPRRRDALQRAVASLSDLPSAADASAAASAELERLTNDPTSVARRGRGSQPEWYRGLGWLGLGGLRDRLGACAAIVGEEGHD